MIYVDEKTVIPSPQTAVEILYRHNSKGMGIPMDYDRLCEYYSFYTLEADRILLELEKDIGFKRDALGSPIKANQFLTYLTSNGVSTGLMATGSNGVSMSAESLKSAIATGLYSEELNRQMSWFMSARTLLKSVDTFKSIIDTHPVAVSMTYDRHRMIYVHPTWSTQNTGRIGASNPAIMNIAKSCSDIFTVPRGWVYYEADSGQMEPKIIQSVYIQDEQLKKCTAIYDDAYFGYLHFCQFLTPEQRASKTLDLQPVEITEEMVKKRKALKTFGNAVFYGSTSNSSNDKDKAAFIKYIGEHPKRLELVERLQSEIYSGRRVFKTFFGTEIDITKGPSEYKYEDKTSKSYYSHLLKCAINNPIQGTAADLMRWSVLCAHRLLRDKAPNSVILMYIHDSGKFAIHEDDVHKVDKEVREIVAYKCFDWLPITADASTGIHPSSGLPRLV